MSLMHYSCCSEYDLMLSAWGEGILSDADLLYSMKSDAILGDFKEKYGRYPKDISLFIDDPRANGFNYGFTGVDTALLEKFTTLKELILPDSIKTISMTPKLESILKKNDTLIRGNFDSFAESFARKNGLRFRPSDYVFARYYLDSVQETTVMKLVFKRNGSVVITEDINSPGSSAGNSFGGTKVYKLRSDFCESMTAEEIAEQFRVCIYNRTIEQGKLAAFIKKANAHGYYKGGN